MDATVELIGLGRTAKTDRRGRFALGSVAPDRTIEIGSAEFGRLVDELAADNRQGLLALRGELLLEHRGQIVLIR